jgi:hypothetical protein
MDELRILIARLGWPSTAARWWTMQELALRLGEPATRPETETALLQTLRERRLEAEVLEVLCVFWMAARGYDYPPGVELADSMPKPSLLSNQLMTSLGLPVKDDTEDLKEVPEEFESPDDFDGVQGVDLPRMFLTRMKRLEARSRLPFVRQMAFEWSENRAAYPDAPYQGDPWHFIRPMGEGFIGQLSSRTAIRAISAYLRALGVGKHFWNMPAPLASEASLVALPIHPTLAFLRPCRPDWFPTSKIDFSGDSKSTEAALRALLARVEETRPGDELIAFNSPVVMSLEVCIEVSVVRWSQAAGSEIDDADLAAYLESFWTREQTLSSVAGEPFSTTTIVQYANAYELVDEESASWPLAGVLDYNRMGYLQHDLYPSRLFLPTMSGSTAVEVNPCGGKLEASAGGKVIADFCYWNAGWGPARPRQLRGNCGTALISRGNAYRETVVPSVTAIRDFYLWRVRTLRRNNTFDKFSEAIASGAMFV